MKKVLIAHQSTIPHYRVAFYNALETLRPHTWKFDVVFDRENSKSLRHNIPAGDPNDFHFSTLDVNTFRFPLFGIEFGYQTFVKQAARYDAIVSHDVVHNISNLLVHLYQLKGTKIAYWGIARNLMVARPSDVRRVIENLKSFLILRANAYFAYTMSVSSYLTSIGMPSQKIFILNNTIDIEKERKYFLEYIVKKEEIKNNLKLSGKKILLLVGRFTSRRRLDFLLESFDHLVRDDPEYILILVGEGAEPYLSEHSQRDRILYLGRLDKPDDLAPIYVISDLFVYPGAVGLAPLQAMCYSLPVLTIENNTHSAEIDYLNDKNSAMLPANTSPKRYAEEISSLFSGTCLDNLKLGTWASISHLTINNMASNFIHGIDYLLSLD